MSEKTHRFEEIDTPRLVRDIKELSAEARTLKDRLRQRWVEPMGEVQSALCRLKWRITQLCILRAWQRGRYHLQKPLKRGAYPGMLWDREAFHARIAEESARAYLQPGDAHGHPLPTNDNATVAQTELTHEH